MSVEENTITVEALIEQLQQLPAEAQSLPVYATYDCFCHTAIYGAHVIKDQNGDSFVQLVGD